MNNHIALMLFCGLFLKTLSAWAAELEDRDDGKEHTVTLDHLKLDSENLYLLNFSYGNDPLTKIDLLGVRPPSRYLASKDSLLPSVDWAIKEIFRNQERSDIKRYAFVDFDGVLARKLLVRTSDNREFATFLDQPNWVIQPDLSLAWKTFAEDRRYQDEILRLATYLYGERMDVPITQLAQTELVRSALKSLLNKNLSQSFSVRYDIVSRDFVNLLKKLEASGYEIFVLSARPFDHHRGLFLLENYHTCFSRGDEKRKGLAQHFADFTESASYIYSTDKDTIIAKAVDEASSDPIEVIFFDDHVVQMKQHFDNVEVNLVRKRDRNAQFLFVPYPQLSIDFDQERFFRDIVDLMEGIPADLLQQIREDVLL